MANACFRFYRLTCALLLGLAGVLAAATTLTSGPPAWGQAPALQNSGQPRNEIRSLKPGKQLKRSLQGGEKHVYEIRARKGNFVHTVALQQGIDVVLALYSPDGKPIGSMDSPNVTSARNKSPRLLKRRGFTGLKWLLATGLRPPVATV